MCSWHIVEFFAFPPAAFIDSYVKIPSTSKDIFRSGRAQIGLSPPDFANYSDAAHANDGTMPVIWRIGITE